MKSSVLVVLVGCAAGIPAPGELGARAVPFEPGAYTFARVLRDAQSVTEHGVSLVLDPDGGARAAVTRSFVFAADHDGELARDDQESIELAGSWAQRRDGIDVVLDVKRTCTSGFGEPPCAHSARSGEPWRLRCRAMVPRAADSALAAPALVCELRRGVPEPRFTTLLAGERVLVVFGPEQPRARRSGGKPPQADQQ